MSDDELRFAKANALLNQILDEDDKDDALSNDLLGEFRKGFPISNLKALLMHPKERILRSGVWIASELGAEARLYLDIIADLLDHSDRSVRFLALDFVQSAARENDSKLLEKVLSLVNDRDLAIRWKVLMFLAQVDHSMLQATLNGLEMSPVDDCSLNEFRFLTSEDSEDPQNITHRLDEPDELVRMCGAVAAARFASTSLKPLELAAKSTDVTVRRFAKDFLERLVA